MNDDAFARLVAEEVKNKVSKNQREYLMLPENWSRWQRGLVALEKNLSNQLDQLSASEKEDTARYSVLGDDGVRLLAEALSDYENRKKKIERFKYHVDNRLDEITKMIAVGVDAVDDEVKMIDFIRRAIVTHKEMLFEFDMEPTPIDLALWASLEGKWKFDNINPDDL
jgi:predicted  nucleic acid-binding Zn-ribbon protein